MVVHRKLLEQKGKTVDKNGVNTAAQGGMNDCSGYIVEVHAALSYVIHTHEH